MTHIVIFMLTVIFLNIGRLFLLTTLGEYDRQIAFRQIGLYVIFLMITIFAYSVSNKICVDGIDGPLMNTYVETINGRMI